MLFRPTDLISVVEAFVVIAVVFTADAAAASDVAAGIPAAAAAAVITWEVYLSRTRRETWSCARVVTKSPTRRKSFGSFAYDL